MPYTVTFVDSGFFSEAARLRAEKLFRKSLESKLGGPAQVAECFSAFLRVSAMSFEDVTPKDLQACAKYGLAYVEAAPEVLESLIEGLDVHFEVRMT